MMKTALLLTAAAVCEAATNVAVLELGTKGSVRPVAASNPETSVEGVVSFFSALHDGKSQKAGMSVVPDLFRKPDSSLVVGIKGVNMDDLDSVKDLADDFVGVLELAGDRLSALMEKVPEVESISLDSLKEKAQELGKKTGISGILFGAQGEAASEVDTTLSQTIAELKKEAEATGRSLVVHFVINDKNDSTRRMSRRLEQNEGGDEDGQAYNPYYGYGYVNAYGDWVTPYKTMFQIQYFNVVLWTSVGLALALVYTIYLMVFMPMEADTLLFGESAKMVGDE